MNRIPKPGAGDYPAGHQVYVNEAAGTTLAEALQHATEEEARVIAMVPEGKWEHRYAPGKWTIKEVFQHIIDTERVFSYRALCIARGEQADLPSMDEDAYQAQACTDRRKIGDLLRELRAVRASTMELFNSFDAGTLARKGTANGKSVSVNALGWTIAGHSAHHLRIIRERYLG
ncbi:MAG: DinB family protein [Bacteroidetes bacterium]|nr:DinB family protein [Bacteroidota bacterium]